jgi:hypothetical protein
MKIDAHSIRVAEREGSGQQIPLYQKITRHEDPADLGYERDDQDRSDMNELARHFGMKLPAP